MPYPASPTEPLGTLTNRISSQRGVTIIISLDTSPPAARRATEDIMADSYLAAVAVRTADASFGQWHKLAGRQLRDTPLKTCVLTSPPVQVPILPFDCDFETFSMHWETSRAVVLRRSSGISYDNYSAAVALDAMRAHSWSFET